MSISFLTGISCTFSALNELRELSGYNLSSTLFPGGLAINFQASPILLDRVLGLPWTQPLAAVWIQPVLSARWTDTSNW